MGVLERTFESSGVRRNPAPLPADFPQLSFETSRLILRPFALKDALTVVKLAGRREIADTTTSIPHPYKEQDARNWITHDIAARRARREVVFAVVTKGDKQLVGAVGLQHIDREHSQAEMGFWIGVDAWGQGYATEAAQALLRFGFGCLALNRIYSLYMLRNPASGRVLKKIDMKLEGILRERVRKWDVFEDVAIMSIIKKEWSDQGTLLCSTRLNHSRVG